MEVVFSLTVTQAISEIDWGWDKALGQQGKQVTVIALLLGQSAYNGGQ